MGLVELVVCIIGVIWANKIDKRLDKIEECLNIKED